ncbi:MAG: hypothetical protein ABEI52_00265, partial [Halobacteriaceae archaeon]
GIADTGRFNYHLNKLRDRFIVKRDGGYAPTAVGLKAIGSIESGMYSTKLDPKESSIAQTCPDCDEQLIARYEDQLVTIECEEDGIRIQTTIPPSAAVNSDVQEIVEFTMGEIQRDLAAIVDGVCPLCSGSIKTTGIDRGDDDRLSITRECRNCWMVTSFPIGVAVLNHPAVISLYYDHGVDIRRQFLIDLDFTESKSNAEQISEDPTVIELTIHLEGDELVLEIDDELNVSERRPDDIHG